MRHDPTKAYKIWHCDLPKASIAHFKALLPIEGSRVWVFQTALDKFLDRVEGDSLQMRWIHSDIEDMLVNRTTPSNLEAINFRISTDSFVRFDRLFPEWGAGTWFFRRFFEALIERMEQSNFNLETYVEQAVGDALVVIPTGAP